jgi:hypothetical protein
MANGLKAHEKDALMFQLSQLLEHDEPSAFLATLQRMAERKAFGSTRGQVDYAAALSWQELADALAIARQALERPHKAGERPRAHVTDF